MNDEGRPVLTFGVNKQAWLRLAPDKVVVGANGIQRSGGLRRDEHLPAGVRILRIMRPGGEGHEHARLRAFVPYGVGRAGREHESPDLPGSHHEVSQAILSPNSHECRTQHRKYLRGHPMVMVAPHCILLSIIR